MQEGKFDIFLNLNFKIIYHFFFPLNPLNAGFPGVLDLLYVLPGLDVAGGSAPDDLKKLSSLIYVRPIDT